MLTCTFVRELNSSKTAASQKLWKVEQDDAIDYRVTSAVVVFCIAETMVFPSTADGEITDYTELEGSAQGDLDHEAAIARHVEALRSAP